MAKSLPTTPIGRALWINAIQPAPDMGGKLKWNVGLSVPAAYEQQLIEILDPVVTEYREKNKACPELRSGRLALPYDITKRREGDELIPVEDEISLQLSRNAKLKTRAGGERGNDPPVIFDSRGFPCKVQDIPPGSTLRCAFRPYVWEYMKRYGINLDLASVQIVKLAEREEVVMGAVEGVEDGFVADSMEPVSSEDQGVQF